MNNANELLAIAKARLAAAQTHEQVVSAMNSIRRLELAIRNAR